MAVRTKRGGAGMGYRRTGGIIAAIINRNRILVLKRNPLLLIARNRGAWTFVSGGMEKGERPIETAYREIEEETRIKRETLTLLRHMRNIRLYDAVRKNAWWENDLFIFSSRTSLVKINWEHTGYRWIPLADIENKKNYTNIFLDEDSIIKVLRAHLKN